MRCSILFLILPLSIGIFSLSVIYFSIASVVIRENERSSHFDVSSSDSDSSNESRRGRDSYSGSGRRKGKGRHEGRRRGGGGSGTGGRHSKRSTSAPAPTCPPGWTLFNRQMGAWCVQLFSGAVGQEQAENSCRAQGAVLSSIENAEERSTLASIGLTMMLPTEWKFGTIRTGLRRDSIGSPWHTTDQFTTGMGGIVWSPLEPNNGYWLGRPNNCGLLWLWVPGGKQEGQRIHGTFFAMECLTSPPDRWRGFLCGKRAT